MVKLTTDTIYQTPRAQVADFVFDDAVAQVFPDMIGRSVPGYGLMVDMIGILAAQYAVPKARFYDLGSSLGACSFAMQAHIRAEQCRIIGLDNSPAMLERARVLQQHIPPSPFNTVEFQAADIVQYAFLPCRMVVMNFTLQFIAREARLPLLKRIYAALEPGGVLVLSEKIQFPNPEQQQLLVNLHHAFKAAQGYSELEIAQKRNAIEHVLWPDAAELHIQRLHSAGFSTAVQWFQCFNFVSFLAIKS